jgi:hypothetical protein
MVTSNSRMKVVWQKHLSVKLTVIITLYIYKNHISDYFQQRAIPTAELALYLS